MPNGVCTVSINLCENIKSFSFKTALPQLENISLVQYRNYLYENFEFLHRITCITGHNGVGKTNLLDAVYLLCFTKSYFTNLNQVVKMHQKDGYRVAGSFMVQNQLCKVACVFKDGKKDVYWNDICEEKSTDHIGRLSAVMIAPNDLSLVNDGGEERRKWMDSILSQVDSTYFDALLKYQKIIQQRNAWLKLAEQGKAEGYALDFYNHELSLLGTQIHQKRVGLINKIAPLVARLYQRLSQEKEQVTIAYHSDLLEHDFSEILKKSIQIDLRLQRTNRGIHKDDVHFLLNGNNAKQYASQGQKKSLLFALKLAQYFYISEHTKDLPILLLDDVFEKLDQQRVSALMNIIESEHIGQVIITDTDEMRVKNSFTNQENIHLIRL